MYDLLNVGLEGIKTNIDWEFKTKLDKAFQDILYDIEVSDDIFVELDKLIYERFGVRTKHYHSSVLYGCIPLGFRIDTALSNNYVEMQNNIKKIDKKGEIEEIILGANDKLVASLVKNDIKINIDEAIIDGLPKDFVVPILINLEEIHKLKINKTYLSAILVHEIGHIFYYITFMLYNGEGNIKTMTKELDNDKTITYSDYDKISERIIDNDNSHNFEYIADSFATRFGYGPILVSALKFLDDDFSGKDDKPFNWLVTALDTFMEATGLSLLSEYIFGKELASHPLATDRYSNIAEELREMIKDNKDNKLLKTLLKDYEKVKEYDVGLDNDAVGKKLISLHIDREL